MTMKSVGRRAGRRSAETVGTQCGTQVAEMPSDLRGRSAGRSGTQVASPVGTQSPPLRGTQSQDRARPAGSEEAAATPAPRSIAVRER